MFILPINTLKFDIISVMNDDISTFPTGKTSEVMPTTKPRPHKMSFKDKIDAIDRLMKIIIDNVHPNDTGFVPHGT